MTIRRKGNALVGILAAIAALVLVFAGLGLSMGWVTYSDSPDKSTIEINKTELKEDTDEAVKATEKFIQDSAASVEEATNDAADELTTEEQETITPVPEQPEQPEPQPVEPNEDAS